MNEEDHREIWKVLLSGRDVAELCLPSHGGRIDLRGFRAAQPTVARRIVQEQQTTINELAGLTEVRNVKWNGLDFSKSKLSSLRIFDSTIEDCIFDSAQCQDWRVWGTRFANCTFRSTNLRNAALGGGNDHPNSFYGVDFTKGDLRGTSHFAAEMTGCRFSGTRLNNVDFQGTRFVDCVFEGEVRDVLFYARAFRGDAYPPNEMKGVDFRKARFSAVEFRGLDMSEVRWPEDQEHVIIENYKPTLEYILEALKSRSDVSAKVVSAIIASNRKWAGPNQQRGVLSKADLAEDVDLQTIDEVLRLIKDAPVGSSLH